MTQEAPLVPRGVVVQLGHAAAQRVADLGGIDLLHIKGYAIDPKIRPEGRVGTDVDVLVRPSQVALFVKRLKDEGWTQVTGFRAGSPFAHAATLWHPQWGHIDVHRFFPGIGLEPAAAFEALWAQHHRREIAGYRCPVPSVTAQALILMLNAARHKNPESDPDVHAVWTVASVYQRARIIVLVRALRAEVAFAAARGELDRYRGLPDYDLWKVMSQGGTRWEEWRARVQAAPTWRIRFQTILMLPMVNVEHLAALLQRPPTRWEIVKEFFARPVRGVAEQIRSTRAPGRNHDD